MLYARCYIVFAKVLQNNIRTIQSKLEEETKAKAVAQDHIIAANHRYTHTQTQTQIFKSKRWWRRNKWEKKTQNKQ